MADDSGMSEGGNSDKGPCASCVKCGLREFGTDRSWGDRGAWRAMFAELLASTFLVFVACGVSVTTTLRSGLYGYASAGRYVCISMAIGFVYVGLLFTVLPHQGQVNPAVTLAVALSGEGAARPKKEGGGSNRVYLGRLLMFWMAQFGGSVIGATLVLICVPAAKSRQSRLGMPTVNSSVTPSGAFLAEMLLSAFFCFVFLVSAYYRATPKKTIQNNQPVIAGTFFSAMLLLGTAVSGAAMNPARYFGPAIILNSWDDAEAYLIAPLLGAMIAAIVYVCFAKSKDKAEDE